MRSQEALAPLAERAGLRVVAAVWRLAAGAAGPRARRSRAAQDHSGHECRGDFAHDRGRDGGDRFGPGAADARVAGDRSAAIGARADFASVGRAARRPGRAHSAGRLLAAVGRVVAPRPAGGGNARSACAAIWPSRCCICSRSAKRAIFPGSIRRRQARRERAATACGCWVRSTSAEQITAREGAGAAAGPSAAGPIAVGRGQTRRAARNVARGGAAFRTRSVPLGANTLARTARLRRGAEPVRRRRSRGGAAGISCGRAAAGCRSGTASGRSAKCARERPSSCFTWPNFRERRGPSSRTSR